MPALRSRFRTNARGETELIVDQMPSLISKVRKLLAMAEGSSNPNEADAFSRKAAELIAAHRIDPERLRAEARDDLDVREFELGRGAYVRGRLALLQVVAGKSRGPRPASNAVQWPSSHQ